MSELPEIETQYDDSYRRVNIGGMFGGIFAGGLEAVVYSEARRTERVLETQPLSPNRMRIRRTIEVELIFDPMVMKSIHRWLGDKIDEYERIFGHIPSPEEVESKSRKRNPNQ